MTPPTCRTQSQRTSPKASSSRSSARASRRRHSRGRVAAGILAGGAPIVSELRDRESRRTFRLGLRFDLSWILRDSHLLAIPLSSPQNGPWPNSACSGRVVGAVETSRVGRQCGQTFRRDAGHDIVRILNNHPLRAGPRRNQVLLSSIGLRRGERRPALSRRQWLVLLDRVRRRCWCWPRRQLLRRDPLALLGFEPRLLLAPH